MKHDALDTLLDERRFVLVATQPRRRQRSMQYAVISDFSDQIRENGWSYPVRFRNSKEWNRRDSQQARSFDYFDNGAPINVSAPLSVAVGCSGRLFDPPGRRCQDTR